MNRMMVVAFMAGGIMLLLIQRMLTETAPHRLRSNLAQSSQVDPPRFRPSRVESSRFRAQPEATTAVPASAPRQCVQLGTSLLVAYADAVGDATAPAVPRAWPASTPKLMVGEDYDPPFRVKCKGDRACVAAVETCRRRAGCTGAVLNAKQTVATLKLEPKWARDPPSPPSWWRRKACVTLRMRAFGDRQNLARRWREERCDHYIGGDLVPAAPPPLVAAARTALGTDELPVIVDVGVHNGDDSAAYLRHGFAVVGLEANAGLLAFARTHPVVRWATALGRVDLRHVAVAKPGGPSRVTFAINKKNPEMSSSTLTCAQQARKGNPCENVVVETTTCAKVINELCGRVYYMKVDIEGFDDVCLNALAAVDPAHRPLYVSSEDQSVLSKLVELGYSGFKLVPHLMWSVTDDEHLPEMSRGWAFAGSQAELRDTPRTTRWRGASDLRGDFRFGKAAREVGDQNDLYACRKGACGEVPSVSL